MDKEPIPDFVLCSLKKILMMDKRSGVSVASYFPLLEELITQAPRLEALPGFFSHANLNVMNIITNDSGVVMGILDWEGSRVLRFGMFAWAIHFLAVDFLTLDNGDIGFVERPEYELMDRACWKSLLDHAPKEALSELDSKMELVQLAVTIGTVLKVLGIQRSNVLEIDAVHLPSLHALPKLLSYRAPFIRGPGERPFGPRDTQDGLTTSML